jgi:diguanylate cyclase (GGDEF)-like protein
MSNPYDRFPARWKLSASWIFALATIGVLGTFHASTNAAYAFASAVIIPVFLVAWTGGFTHGGVASVLAALMWLVSDLWAAPDLSSTAIPIMNGAIRMAVYLLVAYLTSRVRTLLRREVAMASQDALTGLLNRRAFLASGRMEADRARRYNHPMAVLFFDLDNFKQINDTRGHDVGDAALQAAANALSTGSRTSDHVARLGGDEFAMILPEISQKGASEAGEKIAAGIALALEPFPPVTASLGIAWFAHAEVGFADMLKEADALMYHVKHDTKGGIRMQHFAGKTTTPNTAEREPPLAQ